VADDIRRRILDGEFTPGDRLPSEHSLTADYQVARSTVRSALTALSRRGLLESRPSIGWFVRSADQVQGFDRMRSFSQWAADRGTEFGGRFVHRSRGEVTVREARLLRLRYGEQVLRNTRIRMLGERPVMLERSTWAPWVTPIIESLDEDASSTTAALAEAGIDVVHGNHRIEAVAASSEDARLLGVPRSSPLLMVRRETFAKDGRPVEFGEDRYVPGVIVFEMRASS